VSSNLASMGISATMLDTQALIEVYYSAYNHDLFESEKVTDVGRIRIEG